MKIKMKNMVQKDTVRCDQTSQTSKAEPLE